MISRVHHSLFSNEENKNILLQQKFLKPPQPYPGGAHG
jgi:hypothetical protein